MNSWICIKKPVAVAAFPLSPFVLSPGVWKLARCNQLQAFHLPKVSWIAHPQGVPTSDVSLGEQNPRKFIVVLFPRKLCQKDPKGWEFLEHSMLLELRWSMVWRPLMLWCWASHASLHNNPWLHHISWWFKYYLTISPRIKGIEQNKTIASGIPRERMSSSKNGWKKRRALQAPYFHRLCWL